jgi:hypothetical protein
MVEAAVEIELVEHAVEDKPGMQTLNLFELNASELNSKEQVTSFLKEFEITIQHTPDELVSLDTDSLRLYYLDEESRNWIPISSSYYDPENMVLTATVDHFTYSRAGATLKAGPKSNGCQVNIHSGAASQHPLEPASGPRVSSRHGNGV